MPTTTATQRTKDAADEFLAQRRIAVTGVSRSAKDHGANVVYTRLRERGYDVYAVNPNTETVEGDRCFQDLGSIPDEIDGVVLGTAPERTLATVQECIDLGIERVWFHRGPGKGSVDPDAVRLARDAGLMAIDGGCPCMFGPTADVGHKITRPILQLAGKVPRRI
jgi:predicted CoA-binding protein